MQSNLNTSTYSSSTRTWKSTNGQKQEENDSSANANNGLYTRMMQRQSSSNPLYPQGTTGITTDEETEQEAIQALEHARRTLGTLQYLLNPINSAEHLDLAKTQELFDRIKGAEKKLKTLTSNDSGENNALLAKFGGGTTICIQNFARFLSAGSASKLCVNIASKEEPSNTQLELLTAEQVRGICNGLSTLIDDSLRSRLFSNSQLKKLSPDLNAVNDALLLQAMAKGVPTDLPSNGCLLDILSLQSRGLKAKVLGDGSRIVRAFFAHSLDIIGHWPAASGKVVSETGLVVSRQLGKTLVSLNTIKSFNLIKLDKSPEGLANKLRLGQLALALCSEEAMADLTIKPGARHPDGSGVRVPPKGVEVTNIGNTIKDFLEGGFITLKDERTQDVIIRLAKLIVLIPQADMQARAGQTLGNCGNLLRTVYECAIRPGSSPVILQSPAFLAACASLLTTIASAAFWSNLAWNGKGDQTLANSASFLKAMDKWEQVNPQQLQAATAMLVMQVHCYGPEYITEASSIASLLSALVAVHDLAPAHQVPGLIEQLLASASSKAVANWPGRSRATALRAALAWRPENGSPQAGAAIDALLAAGAYIEDPLPYLQAIYLRGKQDSSILQGFQAMLRPLIPRRKQDDMRPVDLSEIADAVKQLEAKEPAPSLRQPAPAASAVPAAPPAVPAPSAKRRLVGETDEVKSISTTSVAAQQSTSRSDKPAKPLPKKNNDWEAPKKIARTARQQTTAEPAPAPAPALALALALAPAPKPASTEPQVKAGPRTGSTANTSTPKARSSATAVNPAAPLTVKALAALARQWFEVILQKSGKGRMALLEEMAAKDSELPMRKDAHGRTSLFHAIRLGDTELVNWLQPRQTAPNLASAVSLLAGVFAEPALVDKRMNDALAAYLGQLDKTLSGQVAQHFLQGDAIAPAGYRPTIQIFRPAGTSEETPVTSTTAAIPNRKRVRRQHELAASAEKKGTETKKNNTELITEKMKDQLEKSVAKSRTRNPLLAAVFNGNTDEVDSLLAKPDAATWLAGKDHALGMTPLLIAIFKENAGIVEKILQTDAGKATALTCSQTGISPLMLATYCDREDMVKLLLALENASIQTAIQCFAPTIMTPLHFAVMYRKINMVRLLARASDASLQAKMGSAGGFTPFLTAVMNGDQLAIDELLKMPNGTEHLKSVATYGANALALAVQQKNAALIDFLLQLPEAESLVRGHLRNGMNVLNYAVPYGDEKSVKQLLASPYAAWLLSDRTFGGQNMLMIMAGESDAESFRIFNQLLALPDAAEFVMPANDNGLNALMIAAKKGNLRTVRSLLALPNAREQASLRCDPETGDRRLAEGSGTLERRYEEKLGISPAQIASWTWVKEPELAGMNAREIALAKGHKDIAALLQSFGDN